jgi:hypothetical protein
MEQQEKPFDGAILKDKKGREKRFPFVELNVTESAKILKKILPSSRSKVANIISKSGMKKRWWVKIRSIAFKKTGLWRIGIIPRELRCSVIKQGDADDIEERFFVYAEAIVQEYNRLLKLSNPSLTPIKNKSEAI